jgi:hypothetical protein
LGGDRDRTGDERLTHGGVTGTWVPRTGWAAKVDYTVRAHPLWRGRFSLGSASVQWVNDADLPFSFRDLSFRLSFIDSPCHRGVRLIHNRLEVTVHDGKRSDYSYVVERPTDWDEQIRAERAAVFGQRFFALYESPESLRDSALADLKDLRRLARSQIPRAKNVTRHHLDTIRRGMPPMQTTPKYLGEEIKRELLRNVESELERREETVRENYQGMYAAIQQALPLREVPGFADAARVTHRNRHTALDRSPGLLHALRE